VPYEEFVTARREALGKAMSVEEAMALSEAASPST
jgi:hypothetical protein